MSIEKSRANAAKAAKAKPAEYVDFSLITEEEWLTREHRVQQRIQDVNVCLGFISDSINDYKLLLKEQSKQQNWERYVSCDGLPRVQYPAELRDFLNELRNIMASDVDADVSWLQAVDERSLLTQNLEQQDLTRQTLEQTLRPNIGAFYEEWVQRILITVDRIEILFACEFEMEEILPERALEIDLVRCELNAEIDVIFDKLTYRIITAPSAYKTSFEDIWECYSYKSPHYNFQLWWLIDVPIRWPYLEFPLMLANLDAVGVTVQIPYSLLADNLTLKCVHTFFDPHSVGAKSYDYPIEQSVTGLNAGLVDIEDCLVSEWRMQVNIMGQMISRMEQQIMAYVESVREYEAKILLVKNRKPLQHKARKPSREPQMLPDGMFPDPYTKFLDREQEEFVQFLEDCLSPKNLHLKPDEINLRQFKILGGVYSMVLVRKPKQTDFEKFNLTAHENGRVVYSQKDVSAVIDSKKDEEVGNKTSRAILHSWQKVYSVKPELLDLHLEGNELPFFHLTFKLPAHLCRYGEPVACQFLCEDIEEEETASIGTGDAEPLAKKTKSKRFYQKRHTAPHPAIYNDVHPHKSINSNPMNQMEKVELRRPNRSMITSKHLNPRNIYRESVLSMLRLSSVRYTILPEVQLHNFGLTQHPLTTQQSYNIQRHCMPRVLSSFVFPLEFRTQRLEDKAQKAARGNKLLRRTITEIKSDEDVSEPEFFNFEKQDQPERLFPVFDFREKIIFEQEDYSSSSNDDERFTDIKIDQMHGPIPETTIYKTIHMLEDIKKKYKAQSKQLQTAQTEFKIKNDVIRYKEEMRPPKDDIFHRSTLVRISDIKMPSHPKPMRNSQLTSSEHDLEYEDDSFHSSPDFDLKIKQRNYSLEPAEEGDKRPKVKHWTTKYIRKMDFDRQKLTCKIMTDRLGIFGFAYKRYMHFPFRDWCLKQNEEDPNEIIFTIDTVYVRIHLFITNAGIHGYVNKLSVGYVARRERYMEIPEPISDYRELRKRFCDKNINIFAEKDASYYIENGYCSEKHLAAELHIYDAIAVHCKLLKFYRCDWNRLASRRNILLCLRNPNDVNEGADVTVRVTPDNSTFVEVTEQCSDDLNIIKLHFHPTWRNIGIYSDLHQLINSMYPQATDVRNRDPKLIYYLRTLFTEVRPLSFS